MPKINPDARLFAPKNPESRLVKKFLQHVVHGEEQQAEDLLDAYPDPAIRTLLLTGTAKVTDYSNRIYKSLTAFQLALCAWDNKMCGMLQLYMSYGETARQYQAIFLEGHKTYAKTQQPFDFSSIIGCITSSNDADLQHAPALQQPNDTAIWQALEQFRQDFTARSQQERIFNPKHLIKALELYDEKFDGLSRNQQDVFWRQVIGYTLQFLPANIAQGLFRVGYVDTIEFRGPRQTNIAHLLGRLMSSKDSSLTELMIMEPNLNQIINKAVWSVYLAHHPEAKADDVSRPSSQRNT